MTLWWGCEQQIDLGSILEHPFTVVVKLESLNPKERVAYVFRKGKLLRTEECAGKMTAASTTPPTNGRRRASSTSPEFADSSSAGSRLLTIGWM